MAPVASIVRMKSDVVPFRLASLIASRYDDGTVACVVGIATT